MALFGDDTVWVPTDHPSIATRVVRNKGGGNGKNCGVINTELFAKETDIWYGEDLYALAAEQALVNQDFVEHWARHGLFSGKRGRSGSPSASHVAAYIKQGNMVTNLTLALLAKAIGVDIYVVSFGVVEKQRMARITKYAHTRTLDSDATIGQTVGEAELRGAFAQHTGPVLQFKAGHWSAFPLATEPLADTSDARPRRFSAAYRP